MRALLLGAPLLLAGCPTDYQSTTLDAPPLLLEAEARPGSLVMLAPASESVIDIDVAERSWQALPVGRSPAVLTRPPGGDVVYTLDLADSALSRVGAGGVVEQVELGAPFNRVDWSPDGQRGVAWIDSAGATIEVQGSLNLGAYAVLQEVGDDLSVMPSSLTGQPLGVHWSQDSRFALVPTSTRLHVLDLGVEPPVEVAVPFTTDDAVRRTPQLVAGSPDGARALVTVQGSSDLFVLNLDPVLIENVVALPGTARAIEFTFDGSQAIVATGGATVTFLDLQSFDVQSLALAHPVDRILPSERPENSFVLLYSGDGDSPFVTRVELPDGGAPDDPETYLLDDAVRDVALEPGEEAAVILHSGAFGAATLGAESLSLFHFEQRAPSRILLDAAATDLLFLEAGVVDGGEDPHALVALKNSARLVRYNLRDYSQVVLDVLPQPHALGVIPEGEGQPASLFVLHDADMGLVSFVDPTVSATPPGGFPAVAGMGLNALLEDR